jgi:hypothetical protein
MQTDVAPQFNDYGSPSDDVERLTEYDPELLDLSMRAGAALVDGDFVTARRLSNEIWARDSVIPREAASALEIKSEDPYRLRMGDVPHELQYWLQHPDERQQHHMEVSESEDGRLHALWSGPDMEGLERGMAPYVLDCCTDPSGEVDYSKLAQIMTDVYAKDFSQIPGLTSYRIGENEAELVFDPSGEDELLRAKIYEMASTVSERKRWGEVGFTFSVVDDGSGIAGSLGDIQVFAETVNGSVDLESAPSPVLSVGHTHPNVVPFSGQDIRIIMELPDIPHMVIVGNNRGYLYLPNIGMSMVELVPDDTNRPEQSQEPLAAAA